MPTRYLVLLNYYAVTLLLAIGKGNDWTIIKYHGDFFGKFSMVEGHDNLECHMVGQLTLRLEKLQFDIAKCIVDNTIQ